MNVPGALLGLLEPQPSHGYELKRAYDSYFGRNKPLPFGQVYATLARLERSGQVRVEGTEHGAGPERKRYAITSRGVTALEGWLAEPEEPAPYLQPVLFAKVVLALLSGRPAARFLDLQRATHLQRMREITARRRAGGLAQTLLADYALFHLEADLRWVDLTAARLDELAGNLARPGSPPGSPSSAGSPAPASSPGSPILTRSPTPGGDVPARAETSQEAPR